MRCLKFTYDIAVTCIYGSRLTNAVPFIQKDLASFTKVLLDTVPEIRYNNQQIEQTTFKLVP